MNLKRIIIVLSMFKIFVMPFHHLVRQIGLGALLLSISLSGCAYQQAMSNEQRRQGDIKNKLGLEQTKTDQLARNRRALEEQIGRLNDQINDLNNQIAISNKEIDKLKERINKRSKNAPVAKRDIIQIQKKTAEVKQLEDEVAKKRKLITSKQQDIDNLYKKDVL